jgi:hypothetical protein
LTTVVAIVLGVAAFSFFLGWYLGRLELMLDEIEERLEDGEDTE